MKKLFLILPIALAACGDADEKYYCTKMCGHIFAEPPYVGCKDYDGGYIKWAPKEKAFRHVGNQGETLFYKVVSARGELFESRPDSPDIDSRQLRIKDGVVTISTADSDYECRRKS